MGMVWALNTCYYKFIYQHEYGPSASQERTILPITQRCHQLI